MALISAKLDRPPGLDALAAAAALSPYHFHRIYHALAGETPMETLARARLSRAAVDLLRTALPLARVAKRAGYGSVPAFARAFRAAYGVPPGAYRARGGIGLREVPNHLQPRETPTMMPDVTIRELPPLRLLALPHRGAYEAIAEAFNTLTAIAGARGLIGPETRFLGLYHDDPMTVPEAELRSEAAITVPEGVAAPEGCRIVELPAQRAAVLRFRGPYSELEPVWTRLYRDWLPQSGEEPGDIPTIEEYLNDCRALPPAEWLTDMMLPLKEKVAA
jgi:AraC family transcriptional regulator